MIRSKTVLLALGMIAFCAGTVLAAPINLDGIVVPGEYVSKMDDTAGEDGVYLEGWNIKALHADMEGDWLYLGLDVDGTFDFDGTGHDQETKFRGFVTLSTVLEYGFTFISTSATAATFSIDGTTLTQGADFDFEIDDDLELMFKKSFMSQVVDSFAFYGRLDNNAGPLDDEIQDTIVGVPEPASMGLLALGAMVSLARRRRRRA